jgi:hypothetical protein
MIAHLIDSKGFSKSVELPYRLPEIRWPLYRKLGAYPLWSEPLDESRSSRQFLTFVFVDYYAGTGDQVAMYREKCLLYSPAVLDLSKRRTDCAE